MFVKEKKREENKPSALLTNVCWEHVSSTFCFSHACSRSRRVSRCPADPSCPGPLWPRLSASGASAPLKPVGALLVLSVRPCESRLNGARPPSNRSTREVLPPVVSRLRCPVWPASLAVGASQSPGARDSLLICAPVSLASQLTCSGRRWSHRPSPFPANCSSGASFAHRPPPDL